MKFVLPMSTIETVWEHSKILLMNFLSEAL